MLRTNEFAENRTEHRKNPKIACFEIIAKITAKAGHGDV